MFNLFIFLYGLWFLRTSKYVLFWLYLWQLKEYHTGRFLDHFKTHNGKKLILNPILLFKIILLCLFAFSQDYVLFAIALYVIYFGETLLFLQNIVAGSFKKPKITLKTLFLTAVSFFALILFLLAVYFKTNDNFWQLVLILIFDVLTPLIVSAIVLLVQPFFVLARNRILKKAEEKIKNLKSFYKKPLVIGITGSFGKTSTKEFLTTILSKKYKVLSTDKHQNSEIGIAQCILNNLNKDHDIFVVEMGSYKKGGIKLLCDMTSPKYGIVTGVNEQHLALFGSLSNLLSAEGGRELAASLPENGMLFLNGDNKHCLDLSKKTDVKNKIYCIKKDKVNSDLWTEGAYATKNSVSFVAADKTGHLANFNVPVLGKHSIQNILAAVLIAKELGMSLEEIASACKQIKQEQAGMVLKINRYGINVVDSSYSANPDGVLADLEYLDVFVQKKILVMPCLIELGKKSAEIHQKIGRKIGQVCDLAIITTKEKFEDIKKGAVEAGMKESNVLLCDNPQDIFARISFSAKSGDAVLLEGRVPGKLIKLLTE